MCKALPHGSGIDSGVKFDLENSTPEKLILTVSSYQLTNVLSVIKTFLF